MEIEVGSTANLIPLPPDTHNCCALWYEVMRQAMKELRTATHRRKASHWFISNAGHVGSFVFCCDLFNIEPDIIRQHLKELIYYEYVSTKVTIKLRTHVVL